MLEVDIKDIARVTAPAIAEAVQAFRENKVIVKPGGGGQYGKIELPNEDNLLTVTIGPSDKQTSIFDY